MNKFKSMFYLNLRSRMRDGFAIGYNVIFPMIMIFLLGLLCKGAFQGEITGYQYYGVVIVPYCTAMAVVTAAYAGKDDAYAKTSDRIMIAPVSVFTIVISKIFAETVIFVGCTIGVLILEDILSGLEIFSYFLEFVVLYTSFSFLVAALGTYIGLGMKDFMKIKNFITIPISIFAILGGSFYRFGTLNQGFQLLINLSPLTWINRSIFLMIYDQKSQLLWLISGLMILIALIFTVLGIVLFKKEEYGNGELPGYEK
ncbi:MAG: ABC transporter permease [Lachnospiraceae bacterium]|nr:ABC transporter permease [Lachnospiraceae bacterium]